MPIRLLLAAMFATACSFVHAATLNALPISGETVTESDVLFRNFGLTDERASVFLGDFMPSAQGIEVHTSSTADTVTITFDFDPHASVSGLSNGFETVFAFGINFEVDIIGSSRTFESLTLTTGETDIAVAGTAFAEIDTGDTPFGSLFLLNIGKKVPPNVSDRISDSTTLAPVTSLTLFNFINGESQSADSSATISEFSLILGLGSEAEPMPPVPLPAGLPLLASGLALVASVRSLSRRNATTQR